MEKFFAKGVLMQQSGMLQSDIKNGIENCIATTLQLGRNVVAIINTSEAELSVNCQVKMYKKS
jgi:hypothetical protein